jgi:O-succinylbenzoic acid--CoA ligase
LRLDEWLTSAARARPDHEAVVAGGRSVTFAELHERADALARRLDVVSGQPVRAPARPEIGFCELLGALPRRGAVLAPLPARAGAPPLPLSDGWSPALRDTVDPHAVHTLIETSGTTGAARAVELTYANHHASALASGAALGVDPGDRWLCPLPLHHVGGLNVLIRCAIHRTTAVLHDGFDAERVRRALEGGEVSLASLVPTMLARLRDAGLRAAPGLRTIALGGGPIPPALLDWAAAAGIPVTPVYGMTETCSQVVAGSPGRAMRGADLRVAGDGRSWCAGRWWRRAPWAPTAGCTRATAAGSTPTGCSTSRAG